MPRHLFCPMKKQLILRNWKVSFFKDFDPQDMAERMLVHDLAVTAWKKLRLDRVSNAVMTSPFNKALTWLDLSKENVSIDDEYLPLLRDLSIYTPDFIDENLKHL